MEFVKQGGDLRPFHFLLIERLDGGQTGGGTGSGAGGGSGHGGGIYMPAAAPKPLYASGLLSPTCDCPVSAMKSRIASTIGSGCSHGTKWPASTMVTILRSSTSS